MQKRKCKLEEEEKEKYEKFIKILKTYGMYQCCILVGSPISIEVVSALPR